MLLGKDNMMLNTMCKAATVFSNNHLLCGLTLPELFACHAVLVNDRMNKPTRAKDLSAALDISKPGVSKLLNGMEVKGLIRREHRAEDRKAVYVLLTDKAIALLDEQKATAAVMTKKVFAEMGMDKAKEMLALLDLFYDSFKKVEGTLWDD